MDNNQKAWEQKSHNNKYNINYSNFYWAYNIYDKCRWYRKYT